MSAMRTDARPPGWGADFGGWLRREREARGMPLVDVAQRTRIKLNYLEAIEQNRSEEVPAEVFLRGFVRAYARAIGADEKEASKLLSAHLAEKRAAGDDDEHHRYRAASTRIRANLPLVAAIGAVLIVVAILVALYALR